MICYFDTSALFPLLGPEPSTATCQQLWSDADAVVASRLLYVEASAALAQAHRLSRLDGDEHRAGRRQLDQLWREFEIVEADRQIVDRAADLAYLQALRGCDAVHCASAELIPAPDLVVASGDKRLLAACADLGMVTADVKAS